MYLLWIGSSSDFCNCAKKFVERPDTPALTLLQDQYFWTPGGPSNFLLTVGKICLTICLFRFDSGGLHSETDSTTHALKKAT